MKSNYRAIGEFIQLVDNRNKELKISRLVGVTVNKIFIESVANTIGTNMSRYKIIRKNQFACSLMQVRRDKKIPVALFKEEEAIISQAYPIFEIIDTKKLLPEYLMMWMSRTEFDREACFYAIGGVRGSLEWEDFCNMQLPVPSIKKQQEIVDEYNTIVDRIKLNEQLNQKLEEMAQAIYKQWFVDFEFEDNRIPKGWKYSTLSDITNILMGQSPSGDSYNQDKKGEIFYQGRTEFEFRFPKVKTYTTQAKRMAKKGDILMSVRAPVGDLNIANSDCCIGRGVASLSSKNGCNSFLYYLMKDIKSMFDISNDEGTIFGSITKDDLHNIEILKPCDDIILRFDMMIQKIDKEIEMKCKELDLLEDMRGILLSKLATINV